MHQILCRYTAYRERFSFLFIKSLWQNEYDVKPFDITRVYCEVGAVKATTQGTPNFQRANSEKL